MNWFNRHVEDNSNYQQYLYNTLQWLIYHRLTSTLRDLSWEKWSCLNVSAVRVLSSVLSASVTSACWLLVLPAARGWVTSSSPSPWSSEEYALLSARLRATRLVAVPVLWKDSYSKSRTIKWQLLYKLHAHQSLINHRRPPSYKLRHAKVINCDYHSTYLYLIKTSGLFTSPKSPFWNPKKKVKATSTNYCAELTQWQTVINIMHYCPPQYNGTSTIITIVWQRQSTVQIQTSYPLIYQSTLIAVLNA